MIKNKRCNNCRACQPLSRDICDCGSMSFTPFEEGSIPEVKKSEDTKGLKAMDPKVKEPKKEEPKKEEPKKEEVLDGKVKDEKVENKDSKKEEELKDKKKEK